MVPTDLMIRQATVLVGLRPTSTSSSKAKLCVSCTPLRTSSLGHSMHPVELSTLALQAAPLVFLESSRFLHTIYSELHRHSPSPSQEYEIS
jgi:hypothetical protein